MEAHPTFPEVIVDEPLDVHTWFDLSYASFSVIPRSIAQSMPEEWQHRFTSLMQDLEDEGYVFPYHGHSYTVLLRNDRTGRLSVDPLGDYQRGRRHVTPQETQTADKTMRRLLEAEDQRAVRRYRSMRRQGG